MGYRHLVTTKYLMSHDENGVGTTVAIVEYAMDQGPIRGVPRGIYGCIRLLVEQCCVD
jgi:hypothetical protein